MLHAVHSIHEARIVHSDLKPANFLVVEGQLKLIDFGIAKAISQDTTSIARESTVSTLSLLPRRIVRGAAGARLQRTRDRGAAQVGTLNYMSPEAIMGGREGTKVGRPSDVWSLGCILYQMVFGRTPFAHLAFVPVSNAPCACPPVRSPLPALPRRCAPHAILVMCRVPPAPAPPQKMHAITDPRAPIEFPECVNADCVDAMRRCLDRNPRTRATIPELLDHAFLHPGRRSAPSEPALTKSQLQVLLGQMCQAQGKAADPETLSAMADTVMQQLQRGEALNLMQFFQ